jgi:uncharacterized protein (TIGR03437 family)
MDWTATASTLSGGSNWLSITPASGTVVRPYLDFSPITVSVNASTLPPGDYYGRIDVSSAGAVNAPQTITIVVNVLPPGANPGPQVRPTGLIFTSSVGSANPGSQTVAVSNVTSSQLQYGSSLTYVGAGNWLQNLPATASVNPNNPVQVVVQPNFSALTPGVTRAYVSLGFSDGNQQAVSVLAVLAPNGAGGNSAGRKDASGCSPSTLQIIPTSAGQAFSANLNQPTTIEVQIVDDCGVALTPDRGGSSVKVGFSNNDPAVTLVHTSQGRWTGTWQPRNPASSTVRATITAFLALSSGKLLANQLYLSVTLATGATVPIVNPGSVLNAASFVAQAPVAPGSLISIFGSNLADGTAQSGVPLPSNLGGTSVVLGGRSVPLVYASNGQLSALVPYDVPVNTQLQLLVQRGSALSVGNSLTVAAAQPAVFTANQQGTGQGVIVDTSTGVLADVNAPATAGDVVVISCTGLGAVDPPVANGAPAPDSPISQTINAVTATIGGVPAQVQFAGLAPGTAGVYQVNVVVPSGVAPGSQVPVLLTVAGQTSPPVTMAVQ